MNGRTLVCIAGGLLLASSLLCTDFAAGDAAGDADAEPRKAINQRMVDAADASLKATQAMYDVGAADVDDVYRWSRRLLEADDFSGEAIERHLTLMRALHKRAAALHKAGGAGGDEVTLRSTEYYVAEAEADVASQL